MQVPPGFAIIVPKERTHILIDCTHILVLLKNSAKVCVLILDHTILHGFDQSNASFGAFLIPFNDHATGLWFRSPNNLCDV